MLRMRFYLTRSRLNSGVRQQCTIASQKLSSRLLETHNHDAINPHRGSRAHLWRSLVCRSKASGRSATRGV